MVFINSHWENVENLNDVSNIIRDSFSTDLADAMDKLLAEAERKNNNLENGLEGEIYDLRDTIEEQETYIEILQDTLTAVFKELQDKQDKNLFNGTLRSLEAKAKRKGITIVGK